MIETKDKATHPCDRENCKRPWEMGVRFVNNKGSFPLMALGQEMHLECYIDLCVETSLENHTADYEGNYL